MSQNQWSLDIRHRQWDFPHASQKQSVHSPKTNGFPSDSNSSVPLQQYHIPGWLSPPPIHTHRNPDMVQAGRTIPVTCWSDCKVSDRVPFFWYYAACNTARHHSPAAPESYFSLHCADPLLSNPANRSLHAPHPGISPPQFFCDHFQSAAKTPAKMPLPVPLPVQWHASAPDNGHKAFAHAPSTINTVVNNPDTPPPVSCHTVHPLLLHAEYLQSAYAGPDPAHFVPCISLLLRLFLFSLHYCSFSSPVIHLAGCSIKFLIFVCCSCVLPIFHKCQVIK